MRQCRRPCCSTKGLIISTVIIFIATNALIIYSGHNMSWGDNLARIPLLLNGLPASSASQDIPGTPNPIQFGSPLNNLTCDGHVRKVNITSCPECLRPAVRELGDMLRKIEYKDNLIPDQPSNFFKTRVEVVQNLVSEFLIAPNISCSYLLAVQPSVLDRRAERDTIRNTWASVAKLHKWPNRNINANMKVVFVVARQDADNNTDSRLQNNENEIYLNDENLYSEAALHNDILYFNMIESYRNLTLKILSAFKWVRDYCPFVKFVLKVDFDTFVNVPFLVDTLLYFENKLEFSILGMIYTQINYVARDGRWEVNSSLYPMRSFPEYASGCGYIVSFKALSKIVEAARHVPIFSVEDAFITGFMRRVVGCQLFCLGYLMTHHYDKFWNSCEMIQDRKIMGTRDAMAFHNDVWEMFGRDRC